jgi:hypothetical protein
VDASAAIGHAARATIPTHTTRARRAFVRALIFNMAVLPPLYQVCKQQTVGAALNWLFSSREAPGGSFDSFTFDDLRLWDAKVDVVTETREVFRPAAPVSATG